MTFKTFKSHLSDKERLDFMKEFFSESNFDFVMFSNPNFTYWQNDTSLYEYAPELDFVCRIMHIPTSTDISFAIRYFKQDQEYAIVCPKYEEQEIFYISDEDEIEATLKAFLNEIENELKRKSSL